MTFLWLPLQPQDAATHSELQGVLNCKVSLALPSAFADLWAPFWMSYITWVVSPHSAGLEKVQQRAGTRLSGGGDGFKPSCDQADSLHCWWMYPLWLAD